jgi:hypothetical protein
MSIRRKRQIIRKNATISGRQAVADPFRPRPTKTELREQAVEAVASYEGPITRCAPKRRRRIRERKTSTGYGRGLLCEWGARRSRCAGVRGATR